MFRKIFIVLSFFALIEIVAPDVSVFSVTIVEAQTKKKRKSLFDVLFGGALKKNKSIKKRAEQAAKARRLKIKNIFTGSNQISSVNVQQAEVIVEKSENASKILIVGDFMASHLHGGLKQMFSSNPGIVMVNNSVALSGLVRDDVHNWPATVGAMVDVTRPVLVVALVGMNDRQMIKNAQMKVKKLEPEWRAEYQKRAKTLADEVRNRNVPMIWVGLPPVSKRKMNADYLNFNEFYRATVEEVGGTFVDVWDGFTDDQGRYVRTGPDINGQIVSLRRSDGINMTLAGKIKLGFYAEKAIKRMTGFGKDALVSSLSLEGGLGALNEPQYDPTGTGKTIVIALASPAADGGNELEGAEGYITATDARQSNSFDLVSKGMFVQPKDGRIDSGWGKPAFDVARSETPEPVLANMRGMSFKSIEPVKPLHQIEEIIIDGTVVKEEIKTLEIIQ